MKFFSKFFEIICNFLRVIGGVWILIFIGRGLCTGNFDLMAASEILSKHFGLIVIINIIIWVSYYNHEKISKILKKIIK